MSDCPEIALERDGFVATIVLDRPAKLNAFTNEMYRAFASSIGEISHDGQTRCLVIRAEGRRAFCVGSDINEFRGAIGNPDRQIADTRIGRAAMDALIACPFPVVAAVEGLCAGGGLQIAAAADIRVASESSSFGIPIKNLGIHAEIEDLRVMHRTLGMNLCADLLFTGRMMEAAEAHRSGFVTRLTRDGEAASVAGTIASEIASGAPLAARWHKRALRAIDDAGPDAMNLREEAFRCFGLDDFSEGCAAFIEKRSPVFNSR